MSRNAKIVAATAAAVAVLAAAVRARMRLDLADKAVLIVGGSRGLGLQIAREAARRGARVGICARSADELDAAQREFAEDGVAVATAICDVRDDASVKAAVDVLTAQLGPTDVLFNVAGIIGVGPIGALTLQDFRDAVETNFFGPLRTTYAVLPQMRARRFGRIVNVTSIGGAIAVPHLLPYCASKFAYVGFSDGLRCEVARDGVKVTTVIPGLMRTGSPPHATFAGQPQKEYALFSLADATPLTSVSVEHAARLIVDAAERGSARLVISWQARLALLGRALAPGLVLRMLTLTGYVLPRSGSHPEHRAGYESETPLTRSPLTAMSQHAEHTQNETIAPASTS